MEPKRPGSGASSGTTHLYVKVDNSMAAGRATPPLLKDLNERTVLEAIRAAAPISRAEISRLVGISKPTVSLALQSLLTAARPRARRTRRAGTRHTAPRVPPAWRGGVLPPGRPRRAAVCRRA